MKRASRGPDVIDRLREVFSAASDVDLASKLGVPNSTVGSWRARRSVPLRTLVAISALRNISLDWLLRGIKPAMRDLADVSPTADCRSGDVSAAVRKGSSQDDVACRLEIGRMAVRVVVANHPANRSKRIARAISRQIGIPVDSIWPGTYSSTTTRRRPRRSA